MILEHRCRDEEGLRLFKEGLRDLLIRVPLAGFSLLGEAIKIEEDPTCETLKTDGRTIWYAPEWMKQKDLKNRIWDILHEWLHIFMNHVARCGDRNPGMWNIAIDIVVLRECLKLLGNGFSVPHDGVQIPPWVTDEMTSEEIYDLLTQGRSVTRGTQPGLPSASDLCFGKAKVRTPQQEQLFLHQFKTELAQAHLVMQAASSTLLPDTILDRIDEILKDTVDWGKLLNGTLLAEFGGPVPTYCPPNRRFLGWYKSPTGTPLLLPSWRSLKEKTLVLAIDVSASVGKVLMDKFIANTMPAACRAETTHVITFDEKIREHVTTRNPRSILSKVKFAMGAHSYTDVRPVFKLVDEIQPSATAVLTDGHIAYPDVAYPKTLWAIPINGGQPPWGRVFQMQVSW